MTKEERAETPAQDPPANSRIAAAGRSAALAIGGATLVLAPVVAGRTALAASVVAGWCGFILAYAFEAHSHHLLTTHSSTSTPQASSGAPPTKPRVIGIPGEHATRLAIEANQWIETPWKPGPLSLVVVGVALTFIGGLAGLADITAAALVGVAGWVAGTLDVERVATGRASLQRSVAEARGKARAGAKAERQVAAGLSRLDTLDVVAHGRCLGAGGDVDHIVIGPCLAAIETKSGGGHLVILEDGRLNAGGRMLPGDPVEQAQRQARALSNIAGHTAAAIVCVPRASNTPRQVGQTTVCNLAQLPGVLSRLEHNIPQDDVSDIVMRLNETDDRERQRLANQPKPRPARTPLRRLYGRVIRRGRSSR